MKVEKQSIKIKNVKPVHTDYGEEIWKRGFISTVHTNQSWLRSLSKTLFKPEEFENTDGYISTVRPTVHTNPQYRSRQRSLSKTSFQGVLIKFENAGF